MNTGRKPASFMKRQKFLASVLLISSSMLFGAVQHGLNDNLTVNDEARLERIAKEAVAGDSTNVLAQLLRESGVEPRDQIVFETRVAELLTGDEYFSAQMPGFKANGDREDALLSYLNMLGFAGRYHKGAVNVKAAQAQFLPAVRVAKIGNFVSVYFDNPAFSDANFADNVEYYSGSTGLTHYVPSCLSSVKNHDGMLEFAFRGKGSKTRAAVPGLDRAATDEFSARLPIVEIGAKLVAKKLMENKEFLRLIGDDVDVVFSGKGLGGAFAQEVAYRFKKGNPLRNAKVVTSQATRYLAGAYAVDFENVVGKSNVLSITTDRRRDYYSSPFAINYHTVKFATLGTEHRLETQTAGNSIFSGIAWSLGFDSARYSGPLADGSLFKTPATSAEQVSAILGRGVLTSADYARLSVIMDGEQAKGRQTSSNALATLRAGDRFLKTSRGSEENENLVKIRKQLGLQNEPKLYDCGNNTFLVVPASYYDPQRNVTVTIAHMAGEKSYYDTLHDILSDDSFSEGGEKRGRELGETLARLHGKVGYVPHKDFHPNNVRFTESKEKAGEVASTYIIDIESMGKNYKAGNVRNPNAIEDIFGLLAKTTSHRFKSASYGASKGWLWSLLDSQATETERAFAKGVIKGYFDEATPEMRQSVSQQFEAYKKKYGRDINSYFGMGYFSSTFNASVFGDLMLSQAFDGVKKVDD